jgi:enamine deaminase RidA (YjgF/YER057c/UK114 family)
MDIEARLKELGITLPAPPAPVAAYVPFTVSGKQVFIAGQLPLVDGKLQYSGHLGGTVSLEDGQAAARICAINVLAQLKAACGDLSRVKACLKLGVFISATADFTQHPEAANGASELIAANWRDGRNGTTCRQCERDRRGAVERAGQSRRRGRPAPFHDP